MFCKKCGNMQKNGEKFCPKCGTPYLPVTSNNLSNSEKAPVNNDSELESNQTNEEPHRQEFTNNNPNPGEKEMPKVDSNSSEDTNSTGSGYGIKLFAKILMWFSVFVIIGTISSIGFRLSWKWLLVIAMAYFTLKLWANIPDKPTIDSIAYLKKMMWIVGGILFFNFLVYDSSGNGNGDVRSENFSELRSIIRESGTIKEDEAKWLVINSVLSSMKNPDSYQPVSWGRLNEINNGWTIEHEYRGTNGFGGIVTEKHLFIIGKDGSVIR